MYLYLYLCIAERPLDFDTGGTAIINLDMENVISILAQMPEEIPQWLKDYNPGDRVLFKDFM